jgi:hypothetical protein
VKTREAMSLGHVGIVAGEKHPQYNKPLTDETKEKISQALRGKKRGPSSLRVTYQVLDHDQTLVGTFNGLKSARKGLKIHYTTLKKLISCSSKTYQDKHCLFSSDPYKQYIIRSDKKHKLPPIVITNSKKRVVKTFSKKTEACKYLKISWNILTRIINRSHDFKDVEGILGPKDKVYKISQKK